jgi:hypothetical protein
MPELNRKERIADAGRSYQDRQRVKLEGVAARALVAAQRTPLQQLKRLDKAGLVAKRERAKLHKKLAADAELASKAARKKQQKDKKHE